MVTVDTLLLFCNKSQWLYRTQDLLYGQRSTCF